MSYSVNSQNPVSVITLYVDDPLSNPLQGVKTIADIIAWHLLVNPSVGEDIGIQPGDTPEAFKFTSFGW